MGDMRGDGDRPRFVVPAQRGRGRHAPAAEERFRALFGELGVGVALSDLSGRFTDVNARVRDLLAGTSVNPDDAGLIDLARQFPADGDQARDWRAALGDVVAGRVPAARAELLVTAPGAPPRRVRVTSAVVAFGERRYLLSLLEAVADLRETDLREEVTDLRETERPA